MLRNAQCQEILTVILILLAETLQKSSLTNTRSRQVCSIHHVSEIVSAVSNLACLAEQSIKMPLANESFSRFLSPSRPSTIVTFANVEAVPSKASPSPSTETLMELRSLPPRLVAPLSLPFGSGIAHKIFNEDELQDTTEMRRLWVAARIAENEAVEAEKEAEKHAGEEGVEQKMGIAKARSLRKMAMLRLIQALDARGKSRGEVDILAYEAKKMFYGLLEGMDLLLWQRYSFWRTFDYHEMNYTS